MGRVSKVFVSGKVGPVIFYEWRGKQCSRAVPKKVRQTKATKASAKLFGKAVRYSRLLRKELKPVLPEPLSKKAMYVLNNALLQWLKNGGANDTGTVDDLSAIEFNEESPVHGRWKVKPVIDWTKPGKIILQIAKFIPSERISAPAHTKTIHCDIRVAGCAMDESEQSWNAEAAIDLLHNNKEVPAQKIELPFTIQRHSLVMIVISLKYKVSKKGVLKEVEDQRWLPVGVAGAYFKA